eukprot:4743_1
MKLNTPQTLITLEYFDKLLGKCIEKECNRLNVHNYNEQFKDYFMKHFEKNNQNKWIEINLQIKFVSIHTTLQHNMHLNNNNYNKFITHKNKLSFGESITYWD